MNITISATPEEITQMINNLQIDHDKFFDFFSNNIMTKPDTLGRKDISNNYSLEKLYQWYEKISWATFYFSHLITVHAKPLQQVDNFGYFLNTSQLSKLGISERSASSRVGGSRRVCKTINSVDVLFIRSNNKEKIENRKFYVNIDAIDDLLVIINENNEEYLEALEDIAEEYPKPKEDW